MQMDFKQTVIKLP